MLRISFALMILVFARFASASHFEICLSQVKATEHRLIRLESIQACFDNNKHSISADICFASAKKVQLREHSIELSENLNAICFYDVSQFKDINSCLKKAELFQISNTHDEAVFECYRQFQASLTLKQCLQVSDALKYPAKKEYLRNHCNSAAGN